MMRFILVDRILTLDPGKSIQAVKHINKNESYFEDHFPGFPVVPGVLLTEMMAQAAGKCLDAEIPERGKAMLAKITSANFRAWVKPGENCLISADIITSRMKFATAKARIEVNGRKVCSAELLFSFLSAGQFSPGYRDEVLEEYLSRKVPEIR